jgi:hypothetical protein
MAYAYCARVWCRVLGIAKTVLGFPSFPVPAPFFFPSPEKKIFQLYFLTKNIVFLSTQTCWNVLHMCVYGRADDCRHIKAPPRRQEARLHARRLQLGVVPVERKALLGYERHVARRRQRRGAEPRRRGRPLERGIAGVEHAVLRAVTRCFAGRGSRARFAGKES